MNLAPKGHKKHKKSQQEGPLTPTRSSQKGRRKTDCNPFGSWKLVEVH